MYQSSYFFKASYITASFFFLLGLISCTKEKDLMLPNNSILEVFDITTTSAKIVVTLDSDGGGTIIRNGFCWGSSPNPTIDDNSIDLSNSLGGFVSQIKDLLPNTTYFVRSYVDNGLGLSYSNEYSFETLEIPTIKEDVVIRSNGILELLGKNKIERIEGNLTIRSDFYEPNISSLENLKHLKEVSGSLTISYLGDLKSLEGLNQLEIIGGGLIIRNNSELQSTEALENLKSIGGDIEIEYNNSLRKISGFGQISTLNGSLSIYGNDDLFSLEGLESIEEIKGGVSIGNSKIVNFEGLNNLSEVGGNFSIDYNRSLSSLSGLENLKVIRQSLGLFSNDKLENLKGLEGLVEIYSELNIYFNHDLISLEGLNSLKDVEYINIYDNRKLNDYCDIKGLIDQYNFSIFYNKYNPSWEDFRRGNCSD